MKWLENQESVVRGVTITNPTFYDSFGYGSDPTKERLMGLIGKSLKGEILLTHPDERILTQQIADYFKQGDFDAYISFNGANHDIPFIISRCLKYGISLPDNFLEKNIDLRQVIFQGKERGKGKLTDFADMIGYPQPEKDFSKGQIKELWRGNTNSSLKNFLMYDARAGWELMQRTMRIGLI